MFLRAKNLFTGPKVFIFIILGIFIIRFGMLAVSINWYTNIVNNKTFTADTDDREYHELALKLLEDRSFENFGPRRTPVYPLITAIIYFLFGVKPYMVIFFQFLLSILSTVMVFYLAKNMFNNRVGWIAAILYSTEPYIIFFNSRLLADGLFSTIFLSFMLFLVLALKKNKLKYVLISAFLLGLATLTKPVVQFFPIPVILILLFYTKKHFKIKSIILFSAVFFLTISIWLTRNYITYNNFTLTNMAGNELLRHCTISEILRPGKSQEEASTEFNNMIKNQPEYKDNMDSFETSSLNLKVAKKYIKKHPFYFIKNYIIGGIKIFLHTSNRDIFYTLPETIKHNFTPPVTTPHSLKGLYKIIILGIYLYLAVIYICSFLGTWSIIKIKEKRHIVYIFYLTTLYFVAITGVIGNARYKLPFIPFYMIPAAYYIKKQLSSLFLSEGKE